MTSFIEKLFLTGSGVSSMRWVFIWTYLVSIVVPLFVWAFERVVYRNSTADIPANVLAFVGIVVGVVSASKVVQGFGEGSVKKLEIMQNGGTNVGDPAKVAPKP